VHLILDQVVQLQKGHISYGDWLVVCLTSLPVAQDLLSNNWGRRIGFHHDGLSSFLKFFRAQVTRQLPAEALCPEF